MIENISEFEIWVLIKMSLKSYLKIIYAKNTVKSVHNGNLKGTKNARYTTVF